MTEQATLAAQIAQLTAAENAAVNMLRWDSLPTRSHVHRNQRAGYYQGLKREIAELRALRSRLNALWRERFEYSEALSEGREALEVISPCGPVPSFADAISGGDVTYRSETARAYSFGDRDRRYHWRIAYAPKADRYFAAYVPTAAEARAYEPPFFISYGRLEPAPRKMTGGLWFDRHAWAAAKWLQENGGRK